MIQRTVHVHVMDTHHISRAWTQSHLEPEDWTRDETEARSMEVDAMSVGE